MHKRASNTDNWSQLNIKNLFSKSKNRFDTEIPENETQINSVIKIRKVTPN